MPDNKNPNQNQTRKNQGVERQGNKGSTEIESDDAKRVSNDNDLDSDLDFDMDEDQDEEAITQRNPRVGEQGEQAGQGQRQVDRGGQGGQGGMNRDRNR